MSKKKATKGGEEQAELTRIAIVDLEKCKPNKCRGECKKGNNIYF
jgi:hypothetical protein